MLKEFEFFHGVAFARLFHGVHEAVSIQRASGSDNAAYLLNGSIGVYIKYSTKRLSPWRFSFQQRHQDEIAVMAKQHEKVFVLLVCNEDGVVALAFDELKRILDEVHTPTEWISVYRGKREMYEVSGSDGELGFKVGRSDFPQKLFDYFSL
jgi:hypothetical protein